MSAGVDDMFLELETAAGLGLRGAGKAGQEGDEDQRGVRPSFCAHGEFPLSVEANAVQAVARSPVQVPHRAQGHIA
jgi:hypothetical protein